MNSLAVLPADIGSITQTSDNNERDQRHNKTSENYSLAKTPAQELIAFISSGNRCGHKKSLPRFCPQPSGLGRFPKILQKVYATLKDSFYVADEMWRSLKYLKIRKKRSERLEACSIVGQYLTLHSQLKDFTVIAPAYQIAHATEISLSRVKRALRDLTRAGYITTVKSIKACFKGAWYGITAIRKLTHKFFLELGISSYAIESAIKHKRGEKMVDTRSMTTKAKDFITNLVSPVNKMAFHEKTKEHGVSTCELAAQNFLPDDIARQLTIKAKEKAKETGGHWFKIFRELQKSWLALDF